MKPTRKFGMGRLIAYMFLTMLSFTTLFPYLWMVLSSFKTGIEISVHPEQFFPSAFSLEAYIKAFKELHLFTGLKNTLIVEFFAITISPLVSALGAFAFSKLALPKKRLLLIILLSSMMVPYAALMLPQFQMWQSLNLVGTLWPLIVPCFFGSAVMTFFFVQYMNSIPTEIFEAAKMDGAGPFRQFFQIMIPLIKPALAAQIVFAFIGTWNDYFIPSIYLNTTDVKTLQLQLLSLQMQQSNLMVMNIVMAGSVLSSIPMLVIFLIGQRFFVESLSLGAVKE